VAADPADCPKDPVSRLSRCGLPGYVPASGIRPRAAGLLTPLRRFSCEGPYIDCQLLGSAQLSLSHSLHQHARGSRTPYVIDSSLANVSRLHATLLSLAHCNLNGKSRTLTYVASTRSSISQATNATSWPLQRAAAFLRSGSSTAQDDPADLSRTDSEIITCHWTSTKCDMLRASHRDRLSGILRFLG
jgi:hypothetical protein